MATDEAACIHQTRRWVEEVIVAHNFCPFARREVEQQRIRYAVSPESQVAGALEVLIDECILLDRDSSIETTLLIYPQGFDVFEDYLDFTALAEALLVEQGYEGITSWQPFIRLIVLLMYRMMTLPITPIVLPVPYCIYCVRPVWKKPFQNTRTPRESRNVMCLMPVISA